MADPKWEAEQIRTFHIFEAFISADWIHVISDFSGILLVKAHAKNMSFMFKTDTDGMLMIKIFKSFNHSLFTAILSKH